MSDAGTYEEINNIENERAMRLEESRKAAAEPISKAAKKIEGEIRRAQSVINSTIAIGLALGDEFYDGLGELLVLKISAAVAAIPIVGTAISPSLYISLSLAKFLIGLFISTALYLYLWKVDLLPKKAHKKYLMLISGIVIDNVSLVSVLPINLLNVILAIVDRFKRAQDKKPKLKQLKKEASEIMGYNI